MTLVKMVLFLVMAALLIEAKKHKHENRLSGGSAAGVGQFPFAVAVQHRPLIFFYTVCGGSLISPNYVLTAAQCARNGQMRVVAGVTSTPSLLGKTILVDSITKHPNFTVNGNDVSNDIAVLKLKDSFQLDQNIGTIGLSNNTNPTGPAIFAGFGNRASLLDLVSSSLQYGNNLNIINTTDCKTAVGSAYSNYVRTSNLCAKYPNGNACHGDEGSALVKDNRTIGVMSWTPFGCSEKDKAIVFTNVFPYVPWIKSVANI